MGNTRRAPARIVRLRRRPHLALAGAGQQHAAPRDVQVCEAARLLLPKAHAARRLQLRAAAATAAVGPAQQDDGVVHPQARCDEQAAAAAAAGRGHQRKRRYLLFQLRATQDSERAVARRDVQRRQLLGARGNEAAAVRGREGEPPRRRPLVRERPARRGADDANAALSRLHQPAARRAACPQAGQLRREARQLHLGQRGRAVGGREAERERPARRALAGDEQQARLARRRGIRGCREQRDAALWGRGARGSAVDACACEQHRTQGSSNQRHAPHTAALPHPPPARPPTGSSGPSRTKGRSPMPLRSRASRPRGAAPQPTSTCASGSALAAPPLPPPPPGTTAVHSTGARLGSSADCRSGHGGPSPAAALGTPSVCELPVALATSSRPSSSPPAAVPPPPSAAAGRNTSVLGTESGLLVVMRSCLGSAPVRSRRVRVPASSAITRRRPPPPMAATAVGAPASCHCTRCSLRGGSGAVAGTDDVEAPAAAPPSCGGASSQTPTLLTTMSPPAPPTLPLPAAAGGRRCSRRVDGCSPRSDQGPRSSVPLAASSSTQSRLTEVCPGPAGMGWVDPWQGQYGRRVVHAGRWRCARTRGPCTQPNAPHPHPLPPPSTCELVQHRGQQAAAQGQQRLLLTRQQRHRAHSRGRRHRRELRCGCRRHAQVCAR